MHIQTESGRKIIITRQDEPFKDNKIIWFDEPVRAIELTKGESLFIATLLLQGQKNSLTQVLREMLIDGFFDEGREFGEIKSELNKRGISGFSSSLSVILDRFVKKEILVRSGKKRKYIYQIK